MEGISSEILLFHRPNLLWLRREDRWRSTREEEESSTEEEDDEVNLILLWPRLIFPQISLDVFPWI